MMHEQDFLAMGETALLRLADVAENIAELSGTIKAADRGRNDALSVVGSLTSRLNAAEALLAKAGLEIVGQRNEVAELRKAIEAQDVEIQGLANRLDANEQAVQSCLSTLGELNKLVRTIASKIPE